MRRTILLFAVAFLTALSGIAQIKIIEHGTVVAGEITEPGGTEDLAGTTVVESVDTDNLDHVVEIWVENTSETETFSLRCRRIELDVLPGTTNNTCWNLCPISTLDAGEEPDWTVTAGQVQQEILGPGEIATSFAFHYEPQMLVGTSTFEVRFVDSGNEDLTYASFNITYDHDGVVGIEEVKEELVLNMIPNPANDQVSLDLTNVTGNVNVKIFNVLGEVMVDRPNVPAGQRVDFATDALDTGIYMVSILQDNAILNTSRLMVKH